MNVILHKFILTLPCHFFLHAAVCILGSKRERFPHENNGNEGQFSFGSQIQMNFVINRILTNTKMTNTATFCWSRASISDKTKRLT